MTRSDLVMVERGVLADALAFLESEMHWSQPAPDMGEEPSDQFTYDAIPVAMALRAALQSVEGGVQVAAKQESCPESAPRTETATVTALRECQRVLAMMIDPESIKSTSVIHAFAAATAAEAKARTVLNGVTTFDGGVEGHAVNSCHIDHVVRHAHEHDQGRSALSSPPKYKAAGIKPGPSDQLTKTPSADHDDGNLRSLAEQGRIADGGQCTEQASQCLSLAFGIIDPDYARIFTIARCLAWAEGYAIAMHGSFTRDLDLIAVPWAPHACEPEHLARRIESVAGLKISAHPKNDKPFGRLVWTFTLPDFGDPRFVDLSIIPRSSTEQDGQAELLDEEQRMIDLAWETHKAARPIDASTLAEEIRIQMNVRKTCVVSGVEALAKGLIEAFTITQLRKTPSAPDNANNLSGVSSAPNHQPHAVSQGWQDIETAPRDGTPFLCFHPDDVFSPITGIDLIWWEPGIGRWTMDGDNKVPFVGEITHWMPLPAPPSPAKTGGAS